MSCWFPMAIAWRGPHRQRHWSVGSGNRERERGLNCPAYSSNAFAAKLIEGLQQVPRPACAQSGKDLLLQAPEPVAPTGSGTAGRPPEVGQAMGEAVTDIRDGGLKSAPVSGGTDLKDCSAARATVSGKGQGKETTIKVCATGSMAPQPPATSRAELEFGPSKLSAALNETLDADFNGQYQCSVFGEFYSLCLGARCVATTPCPISSTTSSSPSNGRYNQTNPRFVSRHREQNHRPSVRRFWETTAFWPVHEIKARSDYYTPCVGRVEGNRIEEI